MADLFPTLLRKEKTMAYGATLQNIVPLGKDGKMKNVTVVITINGDEFDPIECNQFSIDWKENEVRINVTAENSPRSDSPLEDGFIPAESSDFELIGDDLAVFDQLSEFRWDENKIEDVEGKPIQTVTIESAQYNILDMSSIQNAILDLVGTERKYIEEGYKAVQVNPPKFEYEDSENFKLIETVVLYKPEEKLEE